jgi:hypothetical protein
MIIRVFGCRMGSGKVAVPPDATRQARLPTA